MSKHEKVRVAFLRLPFSLYSSLHKRAAEQKQTFNKYAIKLLQEAITPKLFEEIALKQIKPVTVKKMLSKKPASKSKSNGVATKAQRLPIRVAGAKKKAHKIK